MDRFHEFTKSKQFRVNGKKSTVTLFNFSSSLDFQPNLYIGDEQLNIVSHTKILGLTLSRSLKWNEHVDVITNKARSRIYMLRKMMNNGFDYEIILDVYKKEIRSILEYCCVVFHHGLSQELEHQIESVQKLVLKLVSRYLELKMSYNESCILFSIEPLFSRRLEQCQTFIKRTLKSPKFSDMFVERMGKKVQGRRRFQKYRCTNDRMFRSPLVALTRMANKLF